MFPHRADPVRPLHVLRARSFRLERLIAHVALQVRNSHRVASRYMCPATFFARI